MESEIFQGFKNSMHIKIYTDIYIHIQIYRYVHFKIYTGVKQVVFTFYELGLADAFDKDNFEAKLASLKEKWNSLCPEFLVGLRRSDQISSLKV